MIHRGYSHPCLWRRHKTTWSADSVKVQRIVDLSTGLNNMHSLKLITVITSLCLWPAKQSASAAPSPLPRTQFPLSLPIALGLSKVFSGPYSKSLPSLQWPRAGSSLLTQRGNSSSTTRWDKSRRSEMPIPAPLPAEPSIRKTFFSRAITLLRQVIGYIFTLYTSPATKPLLFNVPFLLKNDLPVPKTYGQGSEGQVRCLFSGTPSEIWPGGVLQSRYNASTQAEGINTAVDEEKCLQGGKAREIQDAKNQKSQTFRNSEEFYGLGSLSWGNRHSPVIPPTVTARCGKSVVHQS